MKTVAIIQARMRSTRLYGKVLLPLNGIPTLLYPVINATNVPDIDGVIIATTDDMSNDPIGVFYKDAQMEFTSGGAVPTELFRYPGPEDDVIGRVIAAAEEANADIVVELTADCPLVDPNQIQKVITALKNRPDVAYSSNCVVRSWPDGFDVQAYYLQTLKDIKRLHRPTSHCGWNIAQNIDPRYKSDLIAPAEYFYPDWGLTLDTPEDYELLNALLPHIGGFTAEEVIDYVKDNIHLLDINSGVERKDPKIDS